MPELKEIDKPISKFEYASQQFVKFMDKKTSNI
jgi:hypothetical protein